MPTEVILDTYGTGTGGSFQTYAGSFTSFAAFSSTPPTGTVMFMEVVAVSSAGSPAAATISGWTEVCTVAMSSAGAENWISGGPPDYHRRTLFWRRSDGTSAMQTITGTTGLGAVGSGRWDRRGFLLTGDIAATGDIIVDAATDSQGDGATGLSWTCTGRGAVADFGGASATINPQTIGTSVGSPLPIETDPTRTLTYTGAASGWLVLVKTKGGGITIGMPMGVEGIRLA